MLSLVFALVLLAQAAPASASINFSGDAQVRMRGEFRDWENEDWSNNEHPKDDLKYMYRLRLKASADLGDGYFAKALIAKEAPGWFSTVDSGDSFTLGVSQLYFGRMMENSHYMMGRLPLNSLNNPIFDLTMYPDMPLEIPVFLNNNDRIFGFNYGTKIGSGELNTTLCILDNRSDRDWDELLDDSYALHVSYKTNIGNVSIEPQILAALTDGGNMVASSVSPVTFGGTISSTLNDDTHVSVSGFYTTVDEMDSDDSTPIEYDGYLIRVKATHGPVVAWIDYSNYEATTPWYNADTSGMFIWGQYNWKVYESSMGSFTLSPTVRYLAFEGGQPEWDSNWGHMKYFDGMEYSRLRTELWAQVTF